jgi:histidinol dehydrogenase
MPSQAFQTVSGIQVYTGEQATTYWQSWQGQSEQGDTSNQNAKKQLQEQVTAVLAEVRQKGDEALYAYAAQFGDALQTGQPMALSATDWQAACDTLSPEVKRPIEEAAHNIAGYAQAIMAAVPTQPTFWQPANGQYQTSVRLMPVERVGCYVPAGRFPLASTALMTALSARAAGVKEVILCCPKPSAEVLFAAKLAGVDAVYLTGGAQAVAAMAYGTQSMAPVAMVVGPGNAYVTEAKRQLLGKIGIDMLAGPSEVTIIADESAKPAWLAADLLAQAEHDPLAHCVLLTTSEALANAVDAALLEAMQTLDLPSFVKESSLPNSVILVLESMEACRQACDHIAPEHLQLHGAKAEALAEDLQHYGTLFVGEHATVAFGDYVAGPNHTLPTERTARFSGALSPLTFLRVQQTLSVPKASPYLVAHTVPFATLEGLTAHAHAAALRGHSFRVDDKNA